ncbi:hypothetical protein evm_014822 [Chilo suppressalis]|nr:hypothetical protein evm_014822 [Chilo suppressalis]
MDAQLSTSQDGDTFLSLTKIRPKCNQEHKEKDCESLNPPENSGPKLTFKEKLDDFTFTAIRRIVHQFCHRNEVPTIAKVLQVVNDESELPNYSKETLRKIIKHLNFKFATRSRKSVLIDRQDISWRQRYLRITKQYRREERYIYYQDETWINAGPTTKKTLSGGGIKSFRQAFLDGLTTELKNPTENGKRLIISHIGGEEGFLDDGLLMFEAKKSTEDYHDEVNAECFEEWFGGILPKLKPNAVVVMDNAPYHSRKIETIPKMSWTKARIQEWLTTKNITFEPNMVKATLIDIVKQQNHTEKYAVDEIAEKGIRLLRPPPYHCELNPIELVWAQVKGHVANNNKTYKMQEVKTLFQEGIIKVTPTKWSDCVSHTIKEIYIIDEVTDRFVISVTGSDSDSEND